ncbi:MAG: hypothetical protein IPL98_13645 [Saprospiraceae bacterium]|nr:hypothetical protein [Saprospiraceae bacterium]
MDLKKLKLLRFISIGSTLIGIVLLIFMIKYEDEPGAIPLILILVGLVGIYMTQARIKQTIKQ